MDTRAVKLQQIKGHTDLLINSAIRQHDPNLSIGDNLLMTSLQTSKPLSKVRNEVFIASQYA